MKGLILLRDEAQKMAKSYNLYTSPFDRRLAQMIAAFAEGLLQGAGADAEQIKWPPAEEKDD